MLLKIVHGADAVIQAGQVIAFMASRVSVVPRMLMPAPVARRCLQRHLSVASATDAGTTSAVPGKVLATPAARQLAREYGIDLARITGSGPDGRIERDDVQDAVDRT